MVSVAVSTTLTPCPLLQLLSLLSPLLLPSFPGFVVEVCSSVSQLSTSSSGVITKKVVIEEKLEEALTPTELEVEDVSYQHAGHSGVERGASETHFNVKVVSESFEGSSLVKRHRLVYEVLKDELQTGGVHALSLITKTPREVSAGKS